MKWAENKPHPFQRPRPGVPYSAYCALCARPENDVDKLHAKGAVLAQAQNR